MPKTGTGLNVGERVHLARTVGAYSGGTEVEVLSVNAKGEYRVLFRRGKVESTFPCRRRDLVRRRSMRSVT